jgi:hypothetical protein
MKTKLGFNIMSEISYKIFVEGDSDKKLIDDFIKLWKINTINYSIETINGKNIDSEAFDLAFKNDEIGKNILILDLDNDNKENRINEIIRLLNSKKIKLQEKSIYFFPDNQNPGTKEDFLISMFKNIEFKKCFEGYQSCLNGLKSSDYASYRPENIGKKELVYHYKLLHLSREQNSDRNKIIGEKFTNHTDNIFWYLDDNSSYLIKLKTFLQNQIEQN